jgi:hypothetical protein
MQARVAALNEKASMDGEDVEQWAQFVIDEGIRCKDEEKAYETRLCERYLLNYFAYFLIERKNSCALMRLLTCSRPDLLI